MHICNVLLLKTALFTHFEKHPYYTRRKSNKGKILGKVMN